MQGVVNAVLMMRRGLTPHYWIAAVDESIPFQGIVESTTQLDQTDPAGVHLVYLMNYTHRSAPLFQQSDAAVLSKYWAGLKALFPDLRDDDLPGEPGDPEHSFLGLMRFDYVTIIEGLGGQAPTLRSLDVSDVAPDSAEYPQ